MATEKEAPPRFSLKRWSQRKLEAARNAEATATPAAVTPTGAPVAAVPSPAPVSETPSEALPSIDSLSFESDFAAFLKPQVDEGLKRQALKKLFSDPRFNVMDGLDIYIDDYTQPDPIAPEVARKLVQG